MVADVVEAARSAAAAAPREPRGQQQQQRGRARHRPKWVEARRRSPRTRAPDDTRAARSGRWTGEAQGQVDRHRHPAAWHAASPAEPPVTRVWATVKLCWAAGGLEHLRHGGRIPRTTACVARRALHVPEPATPVVSAAASEIRSIRPASPAGLTRCSRRVAGRGEQPGSWRLARHHPHHTRTRRGDLDGSCSGSRSGRWRLRYGNAAVSAGSPRGVPFRQDLCLRSTPWLRPQAAAWGCQGRSGGARTGSGAPRRPDGSWVIGNAARLSYLFQGRSGRHREG